MERRFLSRLEVRPTCSCTAGKFLYTKNRMSQSGRQLDRAPIGECEPPAQVWHETGMLDIEGSADGRQFVITNREWHACIDTA